MAVKKTIVRKAPKKAPISRAAVKSIDDKYYGPEPIDISIKGFGEALNWYNYMFEPEQTRDWLFDYMKKNDYSKQDIAAIKRLPKYKVNKTVCTVARILMNGNVLPERNMDYFNNSIQEMIELGMKTKAETQDSDKPAISIRERAQAKFEALFADVEADVIDTEASMYDYLVAKEISPAAASYFKQKYQPIYDEVMSNDPDIKEGYGKRLKQQRKYWQSVIDDLDRYVGNKKAVKVRKPRAKKTKSAVDLVKGLKFQKEFPPLKIVSVNPAEVVGAQQLWVYNTKNRKLTRYDALGPSGISVKGTSLTGYDEEKSITKSVRKPEVTINALLGAGKVTLRKFMSDLKTNETKPTGRINTDTILLRVIK